MIKIVSRFPVARERNGTTSRNKEGEGGGRIDGFFFFRRTKKLLVAWRRTNEISGENLTNVFARTYTRRRIAPIPVQFLEFFAIFGKNWWPKNEEKEREKKSIPRFEESTRLESIISSAIPETARPILFPG